MFIFVAHRYQMMVSCRNTVPMLSSNNLSTLSCLSCKILTPSVYRAWLRKKLTQLNVRHVVHSKRADKFQVTDFPWGFSDITNDFVKTIQRISFERPIPCLEENHDIPRLRRTARCVLYSRYFLLMLLYSLLFSTQKF